MANYLTKKRYYNNDCGQLQLGSFTDDETKEITLFISIVPVKEEYKGQNPSKGVQMYDYDGTVFFSIDNEDNIKLLKALEMLKKDMQFEYVIEHNKKRLIIGFDGDTKYIVNKDNKKNKTAKYIFKITDEIELKNDDRTVLIETDLEEVYRYFKHNDALLYRQNQLINPRSNNSSSSNRSRSGSSSSNNKSNKSVIKNIDDDEIDNFFG